MHNFDPNRKLAKNMKKKHPSTDKVNSSLLKKINCVKKQDPKKNKKNHLTTLPK